MRLFSPNSCGVWNAGELWKVWPHNVWPASADCWAQWRVETKHAWHLLILVRSLRSRSTNSKYVWHGMLHSVMSHDHESQSLINTKQSDNRQPASQNRFTPEWPLSTCLSPVSCLLWTDGPVWALWSGARAEEVSLSQVRGNFVCWLPPPL